MNELFERRRGDAIFGRRVPYRICVQCIMDTSDPEIEFDADGICNHCHAYDQALAKAVYKGDIGRRALEPIIETIEKEGRGKPYDCVIGLSGGVDSTYVAYLVKKVYGLRPIAVHLDNGWNSEIAVRNIENIITKLDLHLDTNVLDWEEFRDLQVAFLRASTPDSEIPTDHAIVATLFQAAIKFGVRWVVEGSNVVTEAMVPATWSHGHADWRYIQYLNDHFGGRKLKTYPRYTYFDLNIRFPRVFGRSTPRFPILNYVDYDKKKAMEVLKKELSWVPYGGKHYESIYTRFYQGYILPTKFGFDKRRPHLSCLIRCGNITREQALEEIEKPAIPPDLLQEDREFVIKKLGLTEREFEEIMRLPRKTFWDYPSYERDGAPGPFKMYEQAKKSVRSARISAKQTAKKGLNLLAGVGVYPGEVVMPAVPPREAKWSPREKPTVCIISLTPVVDEPRVRRQAIAFLERGWRVVVAGFGGGRSAKPDGWELIEVAHEKLSLTRISRKLLKEYKKYARYAPNLAERYYWRYSGYESIYQKVSGVACDLVYANDYYTAPIAARLAQKNGVPFAIDCHEYAKSQYMHNPEWVANERPWIDALQRSMLPKAAIITTVCDGIAELLQKDYLLPEKPTVVRSTPPYVAMPFRPTGETIEVLYHGILSPARGLEEAIASVPMWRPEFRLVIRGHGPQDYVESLVRIAQEKGVADRVAFPGPVPFDDLIPAANRSDIGYFVQGDFSEQKRFTLPNKFFEYVMAGTALCVADLPEMARLVRRHGVGRLVRGTAPESIAEVINGFTRASIDGYKRASLEAAKELCWEVESERMMSAFARVYPSLAAPPPRIESDHGPIRVPA